MGARQAPEISGNKQLVFSIEFPACGTGVDNAGMTGNCQLQFTDEELVISGRRFISPQHRMQLNPAYRLGDLLLSSIAGILFMPLVKLYIDIRTHQLTRPARLAYPLSAICDIGGDRDVVGFTVLDAHGMAGSTFCGNTALSDTPRVNRLLESGGRRSAPLPLP